MMGRPEISNAEALAAFLKWMRTVYSVRICGYPSARGRGDNGDQPSDATLVRAACQMLGFEHDDAKVRAAASGAPAQELVPLEVLERAKQTARQAVLLAKSEESAAAGKHEALRWAFCEIADRLAAGREC